jgi:hypothetical protein
MMPGTFPILPALVFPTSLVPSLSDVTVGVTTVDVTAAIAALVWGLGGLLAVRLAMAAGRKRAARAQDPALPVPPNGHSHRFRDAA